MTLEQRILKALQWRALSEYELIHCLDPETPEQEFHRALYNLREQKMWIEKHPIIGGGCSTCACQVTYKWRLTMTGRKELSNVDDE